MKIEWIGEQREIPKIGIFTAGDIREIPDEDAISLIKQGLCIKAKEAKPKAIIEKTTDKED